ncbi:ArnT family glycosyltransferase [Actinomadura alba]|uniref:Glycosyltransferase family 39 protein n=1 Tax=Actinomadura alba TaxID=406431 RepID=A0ABR7LSQ4_9ACTN|nr:glycosyltransferase family 39 protein [Actinomadura alba]MBC6467872.1 glycosyltransferase family 39 protein [Actinomadura alba]
MAGVVAIVVCLVTAACRVGYPYALEWLEGNSLIEAQRLLTGRPLYAAPSVDYVPDGYPPLYFAVSAGLAGVLGVSYLPLRLVSLIGSLACFALIVRMVQRETGDLAAALAAAGLYAATYFAADTWFDFARVDSLFLAFSLAGLYVARWMGRPRGAVAAGLLLGAAFLTKQSALAEAMAIIIALLFGPQRRLAAVLAATFAGVVGLTTLYLGVASHGWYVFYVFELLGRHPIDQDAWAGFWIWYLFPTLGIALGAVLLGVRRIAPVLGAGCLALAAEGYAGLLHTGGAVNNMMPAYAAVALLAGIAMGASRASRRGAVAAMLIASQIALLAITTFDPGRMVPTAADQRVGDGLRAWSRGFGGPVAIFSDPGLNVAAGLPPVAHQGAVYDVLRGTDHTARAHLERSMAEAVTERRFAAIVVEQPSDLDGFPRDLTRYYRRCPGTLLASVPRDVFRPVGGPPVRPTTLWLPTGGGSCEAAFRLLNVHAAS